MSDERMMILQMVSEGKITPEEANKLLQAIDESESKIYSAATESTRQAVGDSGRPGGAGLLDGLGENIRRVVSDSMKEIDDSLREMEEGLEQRLSEASRRDLFGKIEEKMRRSADEAVEQALERAQRVAEREAERAQRLAEREAERVQREAERDAERAQRQAERMARFEERTREPRQRSRFVKFGWAVDKEKVEKVEYLSETAQAGDRLVINNKMGDIDIQFHDGEAVEIQVRKTVWGETQQDAEDRAASTAVQLVRRGSDLALTVDSPAQFMVFGVLWVKDTRLDLTIRVPHGVHLEVENKVGDLLVKTDGAVGTWNLAAKVGEIDVTVPADAGYRYNAHTSVGGIMADGKQADGLNMELNGRVGDGSGSITANVKTGGICIHN